MSIPTTRPARPLGQLLAIAETMLADPATTDEALGALARELLPNLIADRNILVGLVKAHATARTRRRK